jgi:hypothetical protein
MNIDFKSAFTTNVNIVTTDPCGLGQKSTDGDKCNHITVQNLSQVGNNMKFDQNDISRDDKMVVSWRNSCAAVCAVFSVPHLFPVLPGAVPGYGVI